MWLLAASLSLALALCWTLTHLAKQLGHRFQILDLPDQGRKRHERATPRTGGLAICLTMLAGTLALAAYRPGEFETGPLSHFAGLLLLSMGLLCGLGLWDDKCGLRARTKLAWQVVAILPFVCWDKSGKAGRSPPYERFPGDGRLSRTKPGCPPAVWLCANRSPTCAVRRC